MTAYRELPAPKLQRHDDRRENKRQKRGTNHNIVRVTVPKTNEIYGASSNMGASASTNSRQAQTKLRSRYEKVSELKIKFSSRTLVCTETAILFDIIMRAFGCHDVLTEISYDHTNTMHQRESETRAFAGSMKILRLLDTCSVAHDMNT